MKKIILTLLGVIILAGTPIVEAASTYPPIGEIAHFRGGTNAYISNSRVYSYGATHDNFHSSPAIIQASTYILRNGSAVTSDSEIITGTRSYAAALASTPYYPGSIYTGRTYHFAREGSITFNVWTEDYAL